VALATAEAELRADWDAMLGHQLPALPPFDAFWSALPEFFAWISTGIVPTPLPKPPMGTGERLFRPAIGELRASRMSGSAHLETIRFAASNRLCVELAYEGRVRTIEPYSLRQTSEGNILLFACHAADGANRSYRLDRIEGARMTNQPFAPRFAVELSASELAIPTLARQTRSSSTVIPWPDAKRRPRVARPAPASSVVHIFTCALCGKKFRRREMSPTLNPHKNPSGFPCPGRSGIYQETRFP
jgi:hypothetical protein